MIYFTFYRTRLVYCCSFTHTDTATHDELPLCLVTVRLLRSVDKRERKKNGGEEGESDDDMLYGTRTAGARQASSHPEIAENAGNRDNTVHSSCSRGACVVKCVGMAP